MKYTFFCYGHSNIKAKHVRTLEFTKDTDLSERGDCIIGIRADFNKTELQKFRGKIKITVQIINDDKNSITNLSTPILQDTFRAVVNPKFDDEHEMVFRKSLYPSPRTFGHFLNKGANCLDRKMVELLKNPTTKMAVTIEDNRST